MGQNFKNNMKNPKILICDRFLTNQPNCDWKEGWELYYAFNNLGIDCDIAGPGCPISETEIPVIHKKYNFIIVTENYPELNVWKWWDWKNISTTKMQWAIDTHSRDFTAWLTNGKFDYVGLNNKCDVYKYSFIKSFYFPYGVSKKHYNVNLATKKINDVVFIGTLTPERKKYCEKFNIIHMNALGYDYVKLMQESKICFNKSFSYDLNAKMLEIVASGSFMLSNYNENFDKFMKNNALNKMMWNDDNELKYKLDYYLNNDEEREEIALTCRDFIFKNHSYEARADILCKKIISVL